MTSDSEYLNALTGAKRIVIKIGSALLIGDESGALARDWLTALSQDIAMMRARQTEVLIVSSGAIALGRARLGLAGQSLALEQKQACAAAGQARLTQSYEDALSPHNIVTAQALLTLMDTENRRRWLNARSTLETLLSLGAVPIINENDTVATDEIRYGDNDRLAARVAQMVGADILVLLSDIDGLYTGDPRSDDGAEHIPVIEAITPAIEAMAGGVNQGAGFGSGGMVTKIAAARIAVQAGCHMVITRGETLRPISALEGGATASWFKASADPIAARKQWIVGALKPAGTLTVDAGAIAALGRGKSLLPAGVTAISGVFEKGDAVTIIGPDGAQIARGLSAYGALDAGLIIGKNSGDIESALGYNAGDAIVHRDDLVML
ncbi:MAG: glutamate 5-kinase [Robiginitomaculum sp.]